MGAPNSEEMATWAAMYRTELVEQVVPFWTRHSVDKECGGYFTCLLPDGTVYDTDKFVWLQARQVWMLCKLYRDVEQDPLFLEQARAGVRFLRDHARAAEAPHDFHFSLQRDGTPLVAPYNIFSDCFACIAFAMWHAVSGDAWAGELALHTYKRIGERQANPKGRWSKAMPGRALDSLAVPMIDINVTMELVDAGLLARADVEDKLQRNKRAVLTRFLNPRTGVLHENVPSDVPAWDDASHAHPSRDTHEGRLLNPGHGIECAWFLAHAFADDTDVVAKAADIVLRTLELAWDEKHGGLFYFMDALGKPCQQLEAAQKLWWVHLETLVALAMLYTRTGRVEFAAWFRRVHTYTWAHFRDAEHGGEWWGYLDRAGDVLHRLKGGKWKGCFHVPRALLLISNRVRLLYRHSLKQLMSWAVDRAVFNEMAQQLRGRFDANALLMDNGTASALVAKGEKELAEVNHPDAYIFPTCEGGSKYMRNPHPPKEIIDRPSISPDYF